MSIFGSLVGSLQSLWNMNASTLSGAIDIIVVRQPNGTLLSSPFNVRFGKLKIRVNGNVIEGVKMKLSRDGGAYFVIKVEEKQEEKQLVESQNMSTEILPQQFGVQFKQVKQKQGDSSPEIDFEEDNQIPEVQMSLCGQYLYANIPFEQFINLFYQNEVTFEKFLNEPNQTLQDPNLLIRIDDQIYK